MRETFQIRKMIGMAFAVVRGHASPDVIEDTWKMDRIDVPRAPGLGLMLDEVSGLVGGRETQEGKKETDGPWLGCVVLLIYLIW